MSWIRRVLTIVTFCLLEAEAYQFNKHSSTTDFVIESQNYPKSYSTNLNVTWELDVRSGKWGVVFKDFDLDIGSESHDSRDWLEIIDRGGKHVRYSVDIPPLLPYISEDPLLRIHFVSDGIRDINKRGFQLQILYGANEREVQMKIHEAGKTEKPHQEEDSSLALIITTSVLAFVAFVVIIIVVVLIRKNAQNNTSENRNAFGIRRNSGISHSRRTRSTDEAPPSDGQAQQQQQQQQQQQSQQQQQQQQQRPERTVQRSNSQLNWMARAELTTTLQKTASSRPNDYTSTVVVKAAAAAIHTAGTRSRVTSINNTERGYESGLDEYSETVDCLNHTPGTSQTMQEADYDNQQPPSYEESYLVSEALQTNGKQQPGLSHCYENFASNACTALQHLGNETNIYINTVGKSGSRGSINEITIGASNCIIKATCGDTLEDKLPINKSAINLDAPATNIVIYQNLQNKQSTNIRPSSASSIQIIDGYAFIVPSSAHTASCTSAAQLPAVENGLEAETIGKITHSRNATPDIGEVVQVPLQQRSTGACNDIYINTQQM